MHSANKSSNVYSESSSVHAKKKNRETPILITPTILPHVDDWMEKNKSYRFQSHPTQRIGTGIVDSCSSGFFSSQLQPLPTYIPRAKIRYGWKTTQGK
jgi:hypothetical protein